MTVQEKHLPFIFHAFSCGFALQSTKKIGTACCLAYVQVFKNKSIAKILWTIYYHQLRETFLDYLNWMI